MRRRMIGLCIAGLAMPVGAQDYSPEADKAMWCAAAITLLDTMGAYPPEAPNAVAMARVWSRQAFQEFDAAGFTDEMVRVLIESYGDEVAMQLPEYLINGELEALRIDINSCFDR